MTVHHIESGERRPDMNMTALVVTGSPAGAIVAIALVVMGFAGIPEAVDFWSMRLAPRFDSLPEAPLICPA
jgi:hypothetical protein